MYKIAVIGPESTGKSELSRYLAKYFNAPWVPEYARIYVEGLTREYTFEDVCRIARKQIEYEKDYSQNKTGGFVFFDTELIITKVWFEFRFGETPDFLEEQLKTGFFDLYLLCEPDLPWEPDPVREHGDDRDFFFNWYRKEIEKLNKPYALIHGEGQKRFELAVEKIRETFQSI